MICDVHQGSGHLTTWIRPAIKKELEAHFRDDKGFKCRCLTNVANRASPRSSKYTGGLATFMKMKSRLSKSMDCEATLAEAFMYTHNLKANKERFADERSVAHYSINYYPNHNVCDTGGLHVEVKRLSGNDKANSETSVVDPDRVWRETASEPHKNHRFGLGSFFDSGLYSSALAASSTISPTYPQEVIDLREEVQKLTQEFHQQAEQSEQGYNVLLTRVGGAVGISSDLTEKLEQLDRLQADVLWRQQRCWFP
ncbi:hypothetical protein Ahy_B03g066741 [Arachis hypogaea]|uniref:Uncharacterized protein n=1 Tax=Arachis hypogaea TaxID=3818 RepID=A0A445A4Q9_ARAHY|nr:hypothetical protein Ahy_B03g066741 [Arachis hypogaea]